MHAIHRLNPLISRARTRFGLRNKFQEMATRSWQLSPAVESVAPTSIFDPADLQKVTGVIEVDTIEEQFARACGGPMTHRASVAYEIRDAVLCNGDLFSRRVSLPIRSRKRAILAARDCAEYRDAALASSHYGIRYFGHWMLDDLPQTLAAAEIAPPVSVLTEPSPAQRGYLRLLDLKPDEISDAYFERIVVIDDVGQNDYKRDRYRQLHRQAQRNAAPKRSSGVMMLRGTGGVRRVLVNESEVADLARSRGMTVLDPLTSSVDEMINASADTDLVLGVEGSHLTNATMWMSLSGTLVTLQPPQRFCMVAKDRCDCVGIRHGFIVGDPQGEHDFRIDIPALERLLDRVAAEK
jgi:Glycosyltransferase 61